MHRAETNQKGQMTIEMVLIVVLLTGIAMTISKSMRSNNVMSTLIEGPWLPIRGMIEDGVWMKPADAKLHHPNLLSRHATVIGDPPP
jgi:hypothetical protein